MPKTPRAKCLILMQKLRRMECADDNGYCKCASCGKVQRWDEMDGGHFIAKGTSTRWALEPTNIHAQCKGCNGFGMKNGVAAYQYHDFMVEKYGKEFVDMMIATRKDVHKIRAAEYRELEAELKAKIKEQEKRLT